MWLARACINVNVNIDQARRHVQSSGVNDFKGLRRIDALGHRGDLTVANSDVAHSVDIILRVDQVAAPE
jgi:hypothetical protein